MTNPQHALHNDRKYKRHLAWRIMVINLIIPVILLLSILFMGHYRHKMIKAETRTLAAQTAFFVQALDKENMAESDEANVERLQNFARITGTDISLFRPDGTILYHISGTATPHPIKGLLQTDPATTTAQKWTEPGFKKISDSLLSLPQLHSVFNTPAATKRFLDRPAQFWRGTNGRIILTASAPLTDETGTASAYLLSVRETTTIDRALETLQFDLLTIFVALLGMTLLLSMYLSETISQPLNRLAHAAEQIKKSRGETISMPALSDRDDEIGTLSLALGDMTATLRARIDAIESFAADVAHELKNPLTSLHSAIETLDKVKTASDRQKLMDIIHHDIDRMNRLITDISGASRMEAALERETMKPVDITALLDRLTHTDFVGQEGQIKRDLPPNLSALGSAGHLEQVFSNILSNALSFSPPNGTITITGRHDNHMIILTITDQGPGIPEGKEEAIFERFYTERPTYEAYGQHSGLGLAISHYIVTAHHGTIRAENTCDEQGKITGARFIVTLPAL